MAASTPDDMIKLGIPQSQVAELLSLGVCTDEQDAIEKVASGEAAPLIKEAHLARKEDESADPSKAHGGNAEGPQGS